MKALVLSSGGVDSTTCLGLAVDKYGSDNVIALAITYGRYESFCGLYTERQGYWFKQDRQNCRYGRQASAAAGTDRF